MSVGEKVGKRSKELALGPPDTYRLEKSRFNRNKVEKLEENQESICPRSQKKEIVQEY